LTATQSPVHATPLATEPTPCHVCRGVVHQLVRGVPPHRILRCAGCGLGFLDPQPAPQQTMELYSEHYFRSDDALAQGYSSYVSHAADLRATFRDRIRRLPPKAEGNRLLDIGAAAGFFVEQARLAGWAAEGLEPSAWAAAYARSEVGVPVAEGTLETANIAPGSFDVVTFWEVIEHVRDPRDFLTRTARILKRGGRALLSTPDAGSLVARTLGKRWLGWQKVPEHLFYFDRATLRRLLDETGFDVVEERYVPLTVGWPYALERLGASFGSPDAFAALGRMLRHRSVTVNCYYDLMVVARLRG